MIDIGFAGATLGGLLSLLSPCSVMLLPAFFAYAFGGARRIVARTGVFYLGLITSLVPLGVFASTLGALLVTNRSTLITVVSLLVMAAGLALLAGLDIPSPRWLSRSPDPARSTSALATFLLGSVYAVAGVCAGPILGSVLLVASLGTPAYGAFLMALYGLGMCVPLLVLALLWGRLGRHGMGLLRPRTLRLRVGGHTWQNSWLTVISGLLTIGVGVLLLLTEGTAGLGGWLDVASQAQLENRALRTAGRVSDLWFAVAAAVVLIVLGWLLAARRPVHSERRGE